MMGYGAASVNTSGKENNLLSETEMMAIYSTEYEKPWRYDEEYKTARQAELNIELDLNKQDEVLGDESSIEDKEASVVKTNYRVAIAKDSAPRKLIFEH